MHRSDFIQGKKDCESGYPAKFGASNEYQAGYNQQYAIEAARTGLEEQQERGVERGYKQTL